MPRACPCDRWLARATSEPAFRLLPPMVRLIAYELIAWAATSPEKGRVWFGPSVPCSVPQAVSRLTGIPEPEVETAIVTLKSIGFLDPAEDPGTLWIAGARQSAARAAAARINGLKGGRRRKEPVEQTHMLLPLAGGAEPKGTEYVQPSVPSATTTTESLSSVSGSLPAKPTRDAAYVALGEELAALAGLDPVRQRFDYQPVKAWLADGMSAHFIRAVIAEVVARPSYNPGRVNTLAYFTPALHRARAEDAPALQAAADQPMSANGQAIVAWMLGGMDWASRPRLSSAA